MKGLEVQGDANGEVEVEVIVKLRVKVPVTDELITERSASDSRTMQWVRTEIYNMGFEVDSIDVGEIDG